jgi:hypothetical protein
MINKCGEVLPMKDMRKLMNSGSMYVLFYKVVNFITHIKNQKPKVLVRYSIYTVVYGSD